MYGMDILKSLQKASAARGGAGVTIKDVATAIGRSYWQTRRRLRSANPSGTMPADNKDAPGWGKPLLVYDPEEAYRALLVWQDAHPPL